MFKKLLILCILLLLIGNTFAITSYTLWDAQSFASHTAGDTTNKATAQFLTTKTGYIGKIIIYTNGNYSDQVGAIWTDNGADFPGTIIGTSDANTTCSGECTYIFSAPISLESGTKYWIGVYNDGGAVSLNDEDNCVGDTQQTEKVVFNTTEFSVCGDMNVYVASTPPGIDANFVYTVDKSNSIISFVDTTTDVNASAHVVLDDWNWYVDTVLTSTDQNFDLTGVTQNTDYNVALSVCGDYDGNEYCDYTEQNINSGRFFGLLHITTIDESTETLLDDVTMTFDSNTYDLDSELWLDINFLGATSTTQTIWFSKNDYNGRSYEIDMNQYSDLNLSMLMLSDTNGREIEFQVYQSDETTLYTNTYIEMFNHNKDNNYVGRAKTDSQGYVSFYLNPNDENYTMRIYGDTTTDYNAMVLTINKPKDESTGSLIDSGWDLEVTGLAWQSYNNLSGSQTFNMYANTSNEYGLKIDSNDATYFGRKYYVSYVGATTAETLQPYLVDINSAVNTTLYTISGYTQQPFGGVVIKIYKTISTDGRVLVEQVTTDAKGEALISMIANDEYEFEVYVGGVLQGSQVYSVTSTSTSIYISLDDLGITNPTLGSGLVDVVFTPNRGKIFSTDTTLTQEIDLVDYDLGLTFVSAYIYVVNTDVNGTPDNDVNIWSKTITTTTNNITIDTTNHTIDGNTYDTNGVLIIYVEVTTNQGTYYEHFVYSPPKGFDFYKAIGYDLRPFFGCPATNNPLIPCSPMLFIAIFVSMLATVAFAIETGFTGQESMAGMFLVIMGVFTYFGWVPLGLLAIIVVSVIMLMIAIGGRNKI